MNENENILISGSFI